MLLTNVMPTPVEEIFSQEKLILSFRYDYDFTVDENIETLQANKREFYDNTSIDMEIEDTLDKLLWEIKTVYKFYNACEYATGINIDNLIGRYDTNINLFYETESYVYWFRLLPVKTDNNLWVKVYKK